MSLCFTKNKRPGAQIITYARLLYDKGLIAGADGNLSLRLNNERFMVTASGVHKGLMDQEGLILVDESGKKRGGMGMPSSEIPMHLAIYCKRAEACAIIHAHAPWATAASLKNDFVDLSVLAEGKILFPRVEVVPFFPPGSIELAEAAAKASEKAKIFILKAHGVVAWGRSMREAFSLIEALEQNIKIMALSSCF